MNNRGYVRKDRALRALSLAVTFFFLASMVPVASAGSTAPGADQYETNTDKSLEDLDAWELSGGGFKVKNVGDVSATVTQVIYELSGDTIFVDINDVRLVVNESASFNTSYSNYSRLGVVSTGGFVYPVKLRPRADISVNPTSGTAPLTVNFDASGSNDSDGSIQSYSWDFGDGTSGTGETTSHEYSAGSYTATLTVTDDDGLTDSATESIMVEAGTATVEGSTVPRAPVTIVVHSDEYVDTTDANSEGDFMFVIPASKIESGDHEFKIIAGDANQNKVADGPQTGGWKGYKERATGWNDISAGDAKNVGEINLEYDPFSLSLTSSGGSVSAKTAFESTSLGLNTGTEYLDHYEEYKVFDNEPSKFINEEGWKVKEEPSQAWQATYYSGVSDESLGTYGTERIAQGRINREEGYVLDSSIEEVPRYKTQYKAEWTDVSSHEKKYETWSDAYDKKREVRGGDGVSDVSIDSFVADWDYKVEWTTREWVPHHEYVPGHYYRWTTTKRHTGHYYTWERHTGHYYTWKTVRHCYWYYCWTERKRVKHTYHYWTRERHTYHWTETVHHKRWISGYWVGGYESVSHSKTYDHSWRASIKRFETGGTTTMVVGDRDYKVSWVKEEPKEKWFDSLYEASLKSGPNDFFIESRQKKVDTDYKAKVTVADARHRVTKDSWSEAHDLVEKHGGYGGVTSVSETEYHVKRGVYKTPLKSGTRSYKTVAGWPTKTTRVQVEAKNGFSGTVGLSSFGDGADIDLPSSVKIGSVGDFDMNMTPHGEGNHEVSVTASPTSPVNGESFEERESYSLNADVPKTGCTTNWNPAGFLTRRAGEPGGPGPGPGPNPGPSYTLTVKVDGPGTVYVSSQSETVDRNSSKSWLYPEGASETLTANSDLNSQFVGWADGSGADKGNGTKISVSMNEDKTRTAHFSPLITIYEYRVDYQVDRPFGGWDSVGSDSYPKNVHIDSYVGQTYTAGTGTYRWVLSYTGRTKEVLKSNVTFDPWRQVGTGFKIVRV